MLNIFETGIIKTVHALLGKFKCNAMVSKVICKVMALGGILKSGTIIIECKLRKIFKRYIRVKKF